MARELNMRGLPYGMTSRMAQLKKRESAGSEGESFDWILSTEAPTEIWDWDRWDYVNEVLIADGMVVPENGQVPLLDNHRRMSVEDQIGHVSGFDIALVSGYPAVSGKVSFSSDEKSQSIRQKISENHVTDGSVGYVQLNSLWILADQQAAVKGRVFTGPLLVTYEWSLLEFSITPIGADKFAKKM